MSFSALLLPLRPYLTYYQYLAEKNICSRALPLSGSSRRNRCKHTAGRAGKVPGLAHPSPHARGRAPLHTLAPNSSWIHLHPWISSGHPPPSLPGVPGRPRVSPSCPGAGTRPPTWAGTPRQRAPRGSSRNALGLFLRLHSSPARRRDPGRPRKVSLKSPSRGPPPGSGEVEQRRGPGLRPGRPRSAMAPRPHRHPPGLPPANGLRRAAPRRLASSVPPPLPPPSPRLRRPLAPRRR